MKTTQTFKICDNLIGMSKLQDNSIDLTITSPPYDNLRTYGGYSFDFEATARELYRITKNGGIVVWVVGDATNKGNESGTSFKQALYFKEIGFNLFDTMIYMKNGPAYPSNDKYFQIFEYMFVFSKGKIKTFNPISDRYNRWYGLKFSKTRSRRQKDGTVVKTEWNKEQGGQYGKRFNIWKYNVGAGYSTKDKIAFNHPAIFPEQLAKDHILSWSNEGEWVLDPFLGSGTTLKMCMETNRNGIGFEINGGYEAIIKQRLKANTLKLDALEIR